MNKQTDEMLATWTRMQRQLWDNWLQAVKQFGTEGDQRTAWRESYARNLQAWEQSVREALDAQMQWSHSWAEKMSGKEPNEAASGWVDQTQQMMKGWTDAQHRLWSAWFESVKDLDPQAAAERWDTEGRQVLQAWQEAAQRAQDALADWAAVYREQKQAGKGR
ncbi:hypothetical protein [Alkalilimnicola sp. S0819]|uniref:hypothetical protein n=1 Tax=Alkalilimnicola sp. S0819 TaxID=2613922 RepID=UPI001261E80F|nr:hypothetical protein [Alkalilimnicola sp. S0819]KAB7627251.1 hypothetical protein F3N43_04885 [Alkalilimnicola sp. S0819]MPQ15964.1 hypothetical protein [Alkalilimnicola sp. S0819]